MRVPNSKRPRLPDLSKHMYACMRVPNNRRLRLPDLSKHVELLHGTGLYSRPRGNYNIKLMTAIVS